MPQFTNQAVLSYNNQTVSSNIAVGELVDVLALTKNALTATYRTGDDISYAISFVNSSENDITAITLTDNLGGYTFGSGTVYPLNYIEGSVRLFINGVLQTVTSVTEGPPLVISGFTVPAGGNAVLMYKAELTSYAPMGSAGQITNTATATSASLSAPVSTSLTLNAAQTPQLEIAKSLSPLTVTDNDQITYTFLIQNYGNTAADTSANVSVSDNFNPVLSNITVTLNGTALAPTSGYTYTGGRLVTVPGVITVPAATVTQAANGEYIITPGTSTLTVTGTI